VEGGADADGATPGSFRSQPTTISAAMTATAAMAARLR
jgi:hypothetical protein